MDRQIREQHQEGEEVQSIREAAEQYQQNVTPLRRKACERGRNEQGEQESRRRLKYCKRSRERPKAQRAQEEVTEMQHALAPSTCLPDSAGQHGALIQEQQLQNEGQLGGSQEPTGSVPEIQRTKRIRALIPREAAQKIRKAVQQKEHNAERAHEKDLEYRRTRSSKQEARDRA